MTLPKNANPIRRRRTHVDSVPLTVWLPRHTVNRFRLLALDAATGRVRYGFQAQVIGDLLEQWITNQSGSPKE